jgi:hypothetical protein
MKLFKQFTGQKSAQTDEIPVQVSPQVGLRPDSPQQRWTARPLQRRVIPANRIF